MTLTTNNIDHKAQQFAAMIIGHMALGSASLLTDYSISLNGNRIKFSIVAVSRTENGKQFYCLMPDVESFPHAPQTKLAEDGAFNAAIDFFERVDSHLIKYQF